MFEKEAAAIGLKVCVNCHAENEWLNGQCIKCGCRDFRTKEESLEAQKNGIFMGFIGLACIGLSLLITISFGYNYLFKDNFTPPKNPVFTMIILSGMFLAGFVFLISAYNFIKYKRGNYFLYGLIFLSYAVEIVFLLLT